MNKQAIILELAKKHFFVGTLETRSMNHLNFVDVSVDQIKAALEAAYEAGAVVGMAAQLPQAAPQQPLQVSRFVEAANTTVTVEQRADSYLVVETVDADVRETQGFAKFQAEDMVFLSKSYAHQRVDVFMAVVELLGEVSRKM